MSNIKALNQLAWIRDYLRKQVSYVPLDVVIHFNAIAKSLGAASGPDWMIETKQLKTDRIQEVITQLQRLSSELWDLVEPTPEEIQDIARVYEGDYGSEAAELLSTQSKDAWSIAINTCQDVLDYREEEANDGDEISTK
jgi:hypothetical protein